MLTNILSVGYFHEPTQPTQSNQTIETDNVTTLECIKMLKEVIKELGFNEPDDGIKLNKETFEDNIKRVMDKCQLFINPIKSKHLFDYEKRNLKEIKTIKQFMGFMNSLLKEWGMEIKCNRISKVKRVKGKQICTAVYWYSLIFDNHIDKYL